jgi:hypothetical protein
MSVILREDYKLQVFENRVPSNQINYNRWNKWRMEEENNEELCD